MFLLLRYLPLKQDGILKGDNLGTVAFEVLDVRKLEGFSSSSLPEVDIEILDADEICEGELELFTDAPEPVSSSEPFDIEPPIEACPCWDEADLLSVNAGNNLTGNTCSSRPDADALIQNIPGSTPGVEGGFAVIGTVCITTDFSVFLSITPDEGQACVQQIAERCADIGDPIPIGGSSSSSAVDGDPATIWENN